MKITRKKIVSIPKKDIENIDTNKILLNLVYYYNTPIFSKSPKSKHKIYLNSSSFFLKDGKYLEEILIEKKKKPITNLKNIIENRHDINIDFIKIIYNYSNIYFILVKVKKQTNFIDDFKWLKRFDFYKINTDYDTLDLYESIITNNSLSSSPRLINDLDTYLSTQTYLISQLKIYHIYNSMIGDYEIKIN